MFTNGNTKTLGSKVEYGLYELYNDLADETLQDKSDHVRKALYMYAEAVRHDVELDVDETLERVLKNRERYVKELNEAHYRNLENKGVSNSFRQATFPKFMDDRLADIYKYWQNRKEEEDIREILRDFLEAFEDRAEFEGFKDEWQARKDNPIDYAEERLEEFELRRKKKNQDN